MGRSGFAVNVDRDLIFLHGFLIIFPFHRAVFPILNNALYQGTVFCQPSLRWVKY
jgi:hypothetical protein